MRRDTELLERMLSGFVSIEHVAIGVSGNIVAFNDAFARHSGRLAADLHGLAVEEFLTESDAMLVRGWAAGDEIPDDPHLLNFSPPSYHPYTLRCVVRRSGDTITLTGERAEAGTDDPSTQLLIVNNQFATLTRELTRKGRELERANAALDAAMKELDTSYWHLRKIQEVMPICMGCRRVKSDGSKWTSVVDYLRENRIFLSHGYCPECERGFLSEHGLE